MHASGIFLDSTMISAYRGVVLENLLGPQVVDVIGHDGNFMVGTKVLAQPVSNHLDWFVLTRTCM